MQCNFLLADGQPEYVDDFKNFDLGDCNILWRIGMLVWNIAVTGHLKMNDSSVNTMKLDEESRMVQDGGNGLVLRKYEKSPELWTTITDVYALFVSDGTWLEMSLGGTSPEMPIQISTTRTALVEATPYTKRKKLELSQGNFAATPARGCRVETRQDRAG